MTERLNKKWEDGIQKKFQCEFHWIFLSHMPLFKPITVVRGMKYPTFLEQDHIFPLMLGGVGSVLSKPGGLRVGEWVPQKVNFHASIQRKEIADGLMKTQ